MEAAGITGVAAGTDMTVGAGAALMCAWRLPLPFPWVVPAAWVLDVPVELAEARTGPWVAFACVAD